MRTKESLFVVVILWMVVVIAVGTMAFWAFSHPHHHRINPEATSIHVYYMHDGSRAYQGVDGFWYWYILTNSQQSSDSQASSIGTWVPRSYAPWSNPDKDNPVARVVDETRQELESETSTLVDDQELQNKDIQKEDEPSEGPENQRLEPENEEESPRAAPENEPAQQETPSEPSSDNGSSDGGSSDGGGGDSGGSD